MRALSQTAWFVKVLADLQRPESLGADVRELGELVTICGQSEILPVLPFFSPFHFFALLYDWVFGQVHELVRSVPLYPRGQYLVNVSAEKHNGRHATALYGGMQYVRLRCAVFGGGKREDERRTDRTALV